MWVLSQWLKSRLILYPSFGGLTWPSRTLYGVPVTRAVKRRPRAELRMAELAETSTDC